MSQSNEWKLVPAAMSPEVLKAFHLQWDGRAETLWVDLLAYIGAQQTPGVGGEFIRYRMYSYVSQSSSWGEPCNVAEVDPKPSIDGEWVKFENVAPILARIQRLKEQRAKVSRLGIAKSQLAKQRSARIAELEAQLAAAGGAQ